MRRTLLLIALAMGAAGTVSSHGAGRILEVNYEGSKEPGELALAVTYRLWLPEGARTLRGVIVHQHGCGEGANKSAVTAADDLHWQALAAKWDCALLGPSYHQAESQSCRLWCDPRNGSDRAFLHALDDFAGQSGHPELREVPWCLWGHSGGGFWSTLMLTLHPDRIAAIWLRSGSAFGAWGKGEIPAPVLAPAVYTVPVMFNGGVKEVNDPRHGPARVADLAMFKAWREQHAPAGFAPDPRTGHECGDSRYLAIPYLDACLALRLPDAGSGTQSLKPLDPARGWMNPVAGGGEPVAAAAYTGEATAAGWLPNERVAKAWQEYVKTGTVSDATPPGPPTHVQLQADANGSALTWQAEADFESGLGGFVILRDGQEWARLPEKPASKFGRPLFQGMTYHDTPELPLRALRYPLADGAAGHRYAVLSVNGAGLRSAPTETAP